MIFQLEFLLPSTQQVWTCLLFTSRPQTPRMSSVIWHNMTDRAQPFIVLTLGRSRSVVLYWFRESFNLIEKNACALFEYRNTSWISQYCFQMVSAEKKWASGCDIVRFDYISIKLCLIVTVSHTLSWCACSVRLVKEWSDQYELAMRLFQVFKAWPRLLNDQWTYRKEFSIQLDSSVFFRNPKNETRARFNINDVVFLCCWIESESFSLSCRTRHKRITIWAGIDELTIL